MTDLSVRNAALCSKYSVSDFEVFLISSTILLFAKLNVSNEGYRLWCCSLSWDGEELFR